MNEINAATAYLGMGSNLITKELVARKDWASLTKQVATWLRIVKSVREEAQLRK